MFRKDKFDRAHAKRFKSMVEAWPGRFAQAVTIAGWFTSLQSVESYRLLRMQSSRIC